MAKRLPYCMGLLVLLAAALVYFNLNTTTIIINDGNKNTAVKTLSGEIGDAADKLGLKSDDYVVLSSEKKNGIKYVSIEHTFPVTVTAGDKKVTLKTATSTVQDILSLAGFTVDEFDMVEPSLQTLVTKKTAIDYIDVNYYTDECTEIIPYEVKTVYSNKLSCGTVNSTEGSNGLKLVNYTHKLVNGVEVEKTVNSEKIITMAVKSVKTVGTNGNQSITTGVTVSNSSYANCYSTLTPANSVPLDENGVPTNYVKHITVGATAYTYTGHNTSTGKKPQPGYVAVNPKLIPYGTKMYIVSSDGNWVYGYAEAADTGGFTKKRPNNIDLFFFTYAQCISFGRRNIEVYFLP